MGRLRVEERRRPDVSLSERAMENILFIRRTMEASGTFTSVSGVGGIAMGLIAVGAATFAARFPSPEARLRVWLGAAVVAAAVSGFAVVRKASRRRESALSGPGRRFVLNFMPAVLAGAVLTAALFRAGPIELLPGTWLLLYGTGVVTGGAFSVRVVPAMGLGFMLFGVIALLVPPLGEPLMLAGFGGLHVAFGAVIAWRHGG
jgi:hypothetical protein